ncbi:MAG: UDP-4-amino-4,6-dideoxy-N-acetyl-beta-L-altrosamine transaminase [Thiotrichales bacterium 32-46-8]|nr:MAG: UDP-4-amino-4,6-dideoxy-N-acetyl-beta-L-altrosamine transaminase [Thiotrichales bacterium 32-46-8]OYY24281.1 MAG: UDP-4-amino-4,6-dideoxy-N-acetyl-beta-L-altrosamine transaminase [Thiotrichales bacterium 35-46-9]HQT03056.1 UDP-4-amino-4,6-dideoxy-N-acetyl-beta-L-altrosamine transaminase [Thiotrichales bacterium]HQT05066.1 UDP-4-amino-4,6-dideoxy-N-acetyl-beta-L-altrosamine transaminase [Thiotrichales bacterium]
MIPYGRQYIDQADIDAVTAVLTSDFLTQGPAVPAFEQAVAKLVGAKHGVAMNSATSALHVACLALGLGEGDTLWTTPNTFVASANCALYRGASVDFVDIDPNSLNLSIDALAGKLLKSEKTGKLPKIVVAVDFAGRPCDWPALRRLADQYGFFLVDDASHAIGADYNGQMLGGAAWADITIFSFHPVKIITTAEGGMALTNSETLANKLRLLRSHGITRDPAWLEQPDTGLWYYEQQALGYNYRMTDVQAALGLSQLTHLTEWIARRRQLAHQYQTQLAELPLILPNFDMLAHSAWHLYVVQLDTEKTSLSRRTVFDALRAANIGVNVHYIPVYWQPYYRQLGFERGLCPNAENYYQRAISIPMYSGLSDEDQSKVVNRLATILSA